MDEESPRNFLDPTSSKKGEDANSNKNSAALTEDGSFVLPGAGDDHRILTLSDEKFESTPISEMMSW